MWKIDRTQWPHGKETCPIDTVACNLYNGKFDTSSLFLYLNPSRWSGISQMGRCLPSFLWPLFQIKTMKWRNVDQRMETSRVIVVDLLINSDLNSILLVPAEDNWNLIKPVKRDGSLKIYAILKILRNAMLWSQNVIVVIDITYMLPLSLCRYYFITSYDFAHDGISFVGSVFRNRRQLTTYF